jgi:D-3-phosphoglycerate dehydrogenase
MTYLVVVTDRVSKTGLSLLEDDEHFTIGRYNDSGSPGFREALGSAHALIVRSATRVDHALLDDAPTLRVVARAGVGVDNIDVGAASARGVAVFNAPAANTIAAAELTMALMLSMVRRVPAADRSIREGRWDRAGLQGVELRGRILGLIGAGRIGGEVAQRARAFGMRVIAFDPYLTAKQAQDISVTLVSLDDLIATGDVISLHVPLTDETRGLVDDDLLHRVKKGAFLLNVSRGGVIDEPALARALAEGRLAGAALDVYEREPLDAASPLRSAPNLILTPHLGASTREAQIGVAREVAAAVRGALLDGSYEGAVNADMLH